MSFIEIILSYISKLVFAASLLLDAVLISDKILFDPNTPIYGIIILSLTLIFSIILMVQTRFAEEIEINKISLAIVFFILAIFCVLSFVFCKTYFVKT